MCQKVRVGGHDVLISVRRSVLEDMMCCRVCQKVSVGGHDVLKGVSEGQG